MSARRIWLFVAFFPHVDTAGVYWLWLRDDIDSKRKHFGVFQNGDLAHRRRHFCDTIVQPFFHRFDLSQIMVCLQYDSASYQSDLLFTNACHINAKWSCQTVLWFISSSYNLHHERAVCGRAIDDKIFLFPEGACHLTIGFTLALSWQTIHTDINELTVHYYQMNQNFFSFYTVTFSQLKQIHFQSALEIVSSWNRFKK